MSQAKMERDRWAGWRLAGRVALFVAAHFMLTVLAYRVAYAAGLAAPVWWPADGLTLGVLLRAPRKAWAPLLGTLFVSLQLLTILGLPSERHPGPLVGLVWSASDLSVPLLGALLMQRSIEGSVRLARVREVLLFALLGTAIPAILAAALTLLGWSLWRGTKPALDLWGWWGADAFGILTVTPLLLTFPSRISTVARPRPARVLEALALGAGLVLAVIAAVGFADRGLEVVALAGATFPLLAWAAIRFGPGGAAWGAFTLMALCTWFTMTGRGPFVDPGETAYRNVAEVEAFFALATFSALLLASYACERVALTGSLRARVRENEEALALLDAVLGSSPVGIALYDRELRYVRINPALAALNGLPAEQHLGKRLPEVLPDLGEEIERELRRLLESGSAIVGRELSGVVPSAPGELRTFLCSWFPVMAPGHQKPVAVGAMVIDVTERKHQEEELRRSEQRLRSLAEATAQIVWTRDAEGNPVHGARSWSKFTGEPTERYGRVGWRDCIHPEDRERTRIAFEAAIRAGRPYSITYRLRRHDGVYRHMWSRGVPIRDAGGTIREWVGMSVDVSDRIEAAAARERALEEAREAVRVREDFLSIASHELKTPLTPLAARLQVLRRKLLRGEPIDPASIDKAREGLERLTFLINDLLDATRLREARFTIRRAPLRLDEVVREVVASYVDRSELHTLEVELPESAVWVAGERARLVQVVDNLVDNAFKFSPRGGRVGVSLHVAAGEATLAVSDQGIGILAEDQPHIFDRFFRAQNAAVHSYGGLGLGLYISREVVEHHGGRIWLESEPERGSTFFVALPVLGIEPPAAYAQEGLPP